MIGPPPSFYDPDQVAPQPQTQNYQQWLEENYQGQYHFGNVSTMPYSQQPAPAAAHIPQQEQVQQPLMNQYQFVSTVPPSSSKDEASYPPYFSSERPQVGQRFVQQQMPIAQPARSRGQPSAHYVPHQQQSGASDLLQGSVDFHHASLTPESNDLYYMGHGGGVMGGQYSAQPPPQTSQQQQQSVHYQSPGEHLTPSYTPISEVPTLSSSVSPSWHEQQLPTHNTASPPNASASAGTSRPSPSTGKRDRVAAGKAAKGKGRKRQKADVDESDSDDDEEGGEAKNAHPSISVPMGNLPQRLKREYLLAQIRQKDSIIESLLKQLRNPYLATPLSIDAYRMATPSGDNQRRDVIAWLDRLQSSSTVRGSGSKDGARAFQLDARARKNDDDEESEDGCEEEKQHDKPIVVEDHASPSSIHGLGDPDTENYPGLPDDAVPLGLLAKLSISNSMEKGKIAEAARAQVGDDDDDVVCFNPFVPSCLLYSSQCASANGCRCLVLQGVANDTYFLPGPSQDLAQRAKLIEKNSPPDILVHGLITPEDVDKLFEIFYTRINPFISLLDPVLHTPASTFSRCPFLFTVVCAISSRYSDKSEVYPIAMHFAKSAAANSLIDGWKSVELCQAYILMSIYAVPARRWEDDRSWLYTGLAIRCVRISRRYCLDLLTWISDWIQWACRIATDLNLHQLSSAKPQNEKQEREMLNRVRVWQICFNLDRSTATQFGKPTTIKEDYIVRNSTDWYLKSKYNHPYDVHLDAYCSLMRIVAKFHDDVFSDPDTPTGLNQSIDFREVTLRHDVNLERYHQEWADRFARHSDQNDPACAFRCKLLPFLVNYARLVMFSFGFQQAFQRGMGPDDEIFLTKLLRPEFSQFLPEGQETEIFELIGRLIQTLGSPQISIDERHTPKLYSRFLAGLLAKHRRDGATSGRLHTQPPPGFHGGVAGSHRAPPANPSGSSMNPGSHHTQQTHDNGHNVGGTAGGSHGQIIAMIDTSFSTEPIYQPEATYAVGTGPLEVGGSDNGMNFVFDNMGAGVNDDVLATMQAIKNPSWWNTMMMPGFTWPEESQYFGNTGMTNNYMGFQQTAQVHLG
ncbi:hypothetical protein EW146_g7836 [Bondarzewia mesenterica]|uniref:Xylanolytic transcriptional activator regulatory domain-containing protein n=1 Tax=Bondarzewia mesenterica TaxID=1095465 RepID=A0A4S4LJ18_9AGAM|nr:hypothetical protein EW146_g7836 [Bondarzewia mesenterica]